MGQDDKVFRKTKEGLYSSFLAYSPTLKKNVRYQLPNPTPDIELANKQKRDIEIKNGIVQVRAKKRFEFLQTFDSQEKLFTAYVSWRKKTAKRSWSEDVSRLNCYVFPFFIGQMNLNHPSLWYNYWNEFQDYLSTPGIQKRKNTKTNQLSVNTKNNVVKSANSFIAFVDSKESGAPIKRLPEFKFEEIGRRGVESIYSENDIKKLTEELEQPASDLFYTLAHTGMRVGEAIGLQNSDVILGEIPDQGRWIFKQLQDNKCSLYGYILLKSQPKDSNNPTGERVPLKGRKTIAPEYNRIIPIIDETLAEMLLERVKTGNELIFEGYSYQHFYLSLKKLAPRRDVHSLRHTFTTRFVRLCDGDPRAVEKVLGHSKSKVTEIYNHLAQELESKSKSSVPDKIKKIKI